MSQATKYEILYIIRPDLTDDAKKELVERFDSILTENGTEVVESKDWAKKRFAYEINDYKEGIYHIVNVVTISVSESIATPTLPTSPSEIESSES